MCDFCQSLSVHCTFSHAGVTGGTGVSLEVWPFTKQRLLSCFWSRWGGKALLVLHIFWKENVWQILEPEFTKCRYWVKMALSTLLKNWYFVAWIWNLSKMKEWWFLMIFSLVSQHPVLRMYLVYTHVDADMFAAYINFLNSITDDQSSKEIIVLSLSWYHGPR